MEILFKDYFFVEKYYDTIFDIKEMMGILLFMRSADTDLPKEVDMLERFIYRGWNYYIELLTGTALKKENGKIVDAIEPEDIPSIRDYVENIAQKIYVSSDALNEYFFKYRGVLVNTFTDNEQKLEKAITSIENGDVVSPSTLKIINNDIKYIYNFNDIDVVFVDKGPSDIDDIRSATERGREFVEKFFPMEGMLEKVIVFRRRENYVVRTENFVTFLARRLSEDRAVIEGVIIDTGYSVDYPKMFCCVDVAYDYIKYSKFVDLMNMVEVM